MHDASRLRLPAPGSRTSNGTCTDDPANMNVDHRTSNIQPTHRYRTAQLVLVLVVLSTDRTCVSLLPCILVPRPCTLVLSHRPLLTFIDRPPSTVHRSSARPPHFRAAHRAPYRDRPAAFSNAYATDFLQLCFPRIPGPWSLVLHGIPL